MHVLLLVLMGCARIAAAQEDAGRDLLSPERIASLPATQAAAWRAYIATSKRLHAQDTASFNAELRALGRTVAVKAPYSAPVFEFFDRDESWYRADSARKVADAVLTFQAPSGGWSKRTDMTRPRERGMSYYAETADWHYIPTLDNGATTGQLRFMARMYAVTGDARYATSYRRALAYVLAAQQPNGCWPQSFPLEGGYHDAITFNDDVTVLALQALDETASGRVPAASADERARAADAAKLGVRCLVNTQVRHGVWGQQQDPITHELVPARKYELAGLAGRESASIMRYLMTLKQPAPDVVAAVDGAAAWFNAHAVRGYRYDFTNGLRADASAEPIWPRLTELETGKPIFSNRDGVKLYDWNQLTDRRTGYAWFGTEPAEALRKYTRWKGVR